MAEEEKQPSRAPRTPSHSGKGRKLAVANRRCCFVVLTGHRAGGRVVGTVCKIFLTIWDCFRLRLLCVAIAFAGFAYGTPQAGGRAQSAGARLTGAGQRLPSEQQLDQLGQLIARSQRSFKELIDSFDDVAFAVSLDGKLRTVNRRMAELLDISL